MILREKIEQVLREADIEGLIESGAPDDEYQDEAIEIEKALALLSPDEYTEEKVLEVVCGIWTRSFGHEAEETDGLKPRFLEIVREMLD